MIHLRASRFVEEHAAGVLLELRGYTDRASDGPARPNLGDHSVVVCLGVRGIDDPVLINEDLGEVVLAAGASHREAALAAHTVLTDSDVVALKVVVEILGLVVLACLVHSAVRVDPRVDISRVTSLAASSALRLVAGWRHAVDELLGGKEHMWEGILSRQLKAIIEGGGCCVGPAASAVLRNMLVAIWRGIADFIGSHSPDVEGCRCVFQLRQGAYDTRRRIGVDLLSAGWTGRVVEEGAGGNRGVHSEGCVLSTLKRSFLLLLHLGRRSPRAALLDPEILPAHADLGEAVLTPVGSP
mmetsp:Transcript_9786/g.13483  ORF Transcript_9786/g.13483 Transcript_9786/m.13483 type:complete len:298 (-) Transcript_9786:763-1656(-)